MNRKLDELYNLLPTYYRQLDQTRGFPLKALLSIIDEQVTLVEADIDQLYENWFIETCEDWVVPYIGELTGYQRLPAAMPPDGDAAYLIPRQDVANTIRYRRRKGTLQVLELLAAAVAGWTVQAIPGKTAEGKPIVTVTTWRLKSYPVTCMVARCLEDIGPYCYTFNLLGLDTCLYTQPQSWANLLQIDDPVRGSVPLSVVEDSGTATSVLSTNWPNNAHKYYGSEKSFAIFVDWENDGDNQLIPKKKIILADCAQGQGDNNPNWHNPKPLSGNTPDTLEWVEDGELRPPKGYVMIDLNRGRILFPPNELPKGDVIVSYHYGFSADVGGGEYQRQLSQPAEARLYRVGPREPFNRIGDALQQWKIDKPQDAVIEIAASGEYVEPVNVELGQKQTLQLRTANRVRAVMRLINWSTGRPDALGVKGKAGSRFTLDGILVTGRGMRITGNLDQINIRHCTLVPGWDVFPHGEPIWPKEASLDVRGRGRYINIDRSIIGSITVNQDEVATDPVRLHICDSVVDATQDDYEAIDAPFWPKAHAILTIKRSTIIGTVLAHAIELAENSIFTGKIEVQRRQIGCIRFCYLPDGSLTPQRFDCFIRKDNEYDGKILQSKNFGSKNYCRLIERCPENLTNDGQKDCLEVIDAITKGADDGSEMGVYHHLYQPQRKANLETRLAEYLPVGFSFQIEVG